MNTQENTNKFNSAFARSLQIQESDIHDELSPHTTPSWDSFNTLMLISELEASFDTHFTMEEVTSITNVRYAKDLLRKRGIDL